MEKLMYTYYSPDPFVVDPNIPESVYREGMRLTQRIVNAISTPEQFVRWALSQPNTSSWDAPIAFSRDSYNCPMNKFLTSLLETETLFKRVEVTQHNTHLVLDCSSVGDGAYPMATMLSLPHPDWVRAFIVHIDEYGDSKSGRPDVDKVPLSRAEILSVLAYQIPEQVPQSEYMKDFIQERGRSISQDINIEKRLTALKETGSPVTA